MKLLQAVNTHINEGPMSALADFFHKQNGTATPEKKEITDSGAESRAGAVRSADVDDVLSTFTSDILSTSQERVFLYLSRKTLTDRYLVGGMGAKMATPDFISDTTLRALAKSFPGSKIRPSDIKEDATPNFFRLMTGKSFKLVDITKTDGLALEGGKIPGASDVQEIVVLDVPVNQLNKFRDAVKDGAPEDMANARKAFAILMSHHYYVMTLNLKKALNHAMVEDVINPGIVDNHPDAKFFNNVKDAWAKQQQEADPEVQQDKANDKEFAKKSKDVAHTNRMKDLDTEQTSKFQEQILKVLANNTDAKQAADIIKDRSDGSVEKIQSAIKFIHTDVSSRNDVAAILKTFIPS